MEHTDNTLGDDRSHPGPPPPPRYRVIIPECFGHTELRSRLTSLVARDGGMVVVAPRGGVGASANYGYEED